MSEVVHESYQLVKQIATNDNYILGLVRVPDVTRTVYGIIHKEYGVLEMVLSVYPEALDTFMALDTAVKENAGGIKLPEVVLPEGSVN